MSARPWKILSLFGTRPEIIKLAPVIHALEARRERFRCLNVNSGQHTDLLHPFARELVVRLDRDLAVGTERQTPLQVCHRVLDRLDPVLESERPDAIVVEGDTSTALAGALAGFHRRIPVAHVEAGLRTQDPTSPFPEEMNRRLITRLASLHLAPTRRNVETLRSEGVPAERIALTGNPIVDSVQWALGRTGPSARIESLLEQVGELRLVVLTTHRRESFGPVMAGHLRALHAFLERHADTAVIFPVHLNPQVRDTARRELGSSPRAFLVEPLEYLDFVYLLSRAWLIVSDSGGVQEEAPSAGRPLLVIRGNSERGEVIEAGAARLVGSATGALASLLEESYPDVGWFAALEPHQNPFGRGDSGPRIADALDAFLARGIL